MYNQKLYYICNPIIKNIENIDLDKVKEYLTKELSLCLNNGKKPDWPLRKLVAVYDLIKNK